MAEQITVVGGSGAVGRAMTAFYPSAKIYDKYAPVDPIDVAARSQYIFVAVPTPYRDQASAPDLAEMNDAIATVVSHLPDPPNQVIIIKSTVVPGTTDRYQQEYPHTNFIFNPEFLTERTATFDFANPDKQLVGYTLKSKPFAQSVLDILPAAPYRKAISAKAAEQAKYSVNSFYAFKVIFANTIYDLCAKLGVDYDIVHKALTHDSRIVDSHFDIAHGGYRGYGGKCLPKDIKTLNWFARQYGFEPKFIQGLIGLNEKLIKQKSLIEQP